MTESGADVGTRERGPDDTVFRGPLSLDDAHNFV